VAATSAPPTRVIGIGASAGGLEALMKVVGALPADLPAAVCIVLHVPPLGRSLLAPILDRRSAISVTAARHGEELAAGHVYTAPADRHLFVHDGRIELSRGPKENGVRPAVDVLLRSVAAYRRRGIAVVLSGTLGDGSAGARAVERAGGTVIVQDLDDALFPSMPATTLAAIKAPDHVVAAEELGELLEKLAHEPVPEEEDVPVGVGDSDPAFQRPEGPATGFTCPECSGALWELREGELVRYRCRVGHAYSEEAFVNDQRGAVEAAMWAALEMLEERVELLRRTAKRHAGTNARMHMSFEAAADNALERADLIRRALRADGELSDLLTAEPTGPEVS
jgi:two-component system chemotaxis response regulator CheB